ncbi:hypothetical protein BG006_003433 [Podila minutissima]|uniref:RRM domain-containing protein n=1 Tax=Podila minutissima TaxID=64525 RepID=A0A9P5SM43_9FUNG|nr:hypothetical protein BG006_003433 [Podila minutissima]
MFDQASFYNNGQGIDPSGDFVPAIKQEDFEDSLDHLFAQQLEEYHNTHGDEDLASEDGDDVNNQQGFKKRHNRSMSPGQKALIEERISMERPNRTLFVRNIDKFGINEHDIRQLYKPYGDIRNICNLIEKRGIVFINFYDIRAAEYAKKETHELQLKNRKLDVHFSLPKNPSVTHRNCEESDNQGTLFMHLRQAGKEDINDSELKEVFEQWGEVRSIRRHKQTTHQRFVEFFDSRACVKAHHNGQNFPFHRGSFDLKYAWDSPKYGQPKPIFNKRRSFDKPSFRRTNSRSPSPKRTPYDNDRGSHGTKRRRSSVESRSEHRARRDTYSPGRSARRLSRSRSRDRHDARNRKGDSDRVKREYDNTPDFRNIRSSRYEFGDKRFTNEATRTRSPDNRKSDDYRSKDDRDRRSGSVRPERNTFVGGRRGSSEYRSDRPMMDRGRQGSYSRGGHESDRRRSSFSNRGNHVVKNEEGYHPSFSSQNLMRPPMTPFDISVQERMEKAHQAQQTPGAPLSRGPPPPPPMPPMPVSAPLASPIALASDTKSSTESQVQQLLQLLVITCMHFVLLDPSSGTKSCGQFNECWFFVFIADRSAVVGAPSQPVISGGAAASAAPAATTPTTDASSEWAPLPPQHDTALSALDLSQKQRNYMTSLEKQSNGDGMEAYERGPSSGAPFGSRKEHYSGDHYHQQGSRDFSEPSQKRVKQDFQDSEHQYSKYSGGTSGPSQSFPIRNDSFSYREGSVANSTRGPVRHDESRTWDNNSSYRQDERSTFDDERESYHGDDGEGERRPHPNFRHNSYGERGRGRSRGRGRGGDRGFIRGGYRGRGGRGGFARDSDFGRGDFERERSVPRWNNDNNSSNNNNNNRNYGR